MKIVSIDVGTSSVKAAAYDLEGRELAASLREYSLERPRPGWVEVDPEVYWEKTREALAEVVARTGRPEEIGAVGVASQGETLICLDRNGAPARKAIVWLDTRAVEEARLIESHFGADKIYRVTGQHETSPGYTASLLLWLRRHEPEVFVRTSKFLLVTDYIVYKLTGRWVSHRALYPSTLYCDLRDGSWWPEMLDFLGVKAAVLPELVVSGVPAGKVRCPGLGIPASAVVCPAPIDQVTGALGAGNFESGVISESTGTVLALCGVTDHPPYDRLRRFCIFPHALEGRFVAMPWASASGSILGWFRENFASGLDYDQLAAEAAGVAAGSDGLTVLPHFEGINLPVRIVGARGAFWGVTPAHRRAHFTRAIMESVAFLLKDYFSILEAAGISGRRFISLGGAARSALWSQIKSDVLEKEVVTNRVSETVCLGAAMIAAAGAGWYGDCGEASRKMVQPKRIFTPSEAAVTYRGLYEEYRRLNELHRIFYESVPGAPGMKESNHG